MTFRFCVDAFLFCVLVLRGLWLSFWSLSLETVSTYVTAMMRLIFSMIVYGFGTGVGSLSRASKVGKCLNLLHKYLTKYGRFRGKGDKMI